MFSLLQSFFVPGRQPAARIESDSIGAAVERAVDGIDPRLRAVPHYRRILWRPVERATHYLAECVTDLPPAIAFDRHRFSAEPRLRALFVGPDQLLEILSASPDLRGFLNKNKHALPDELFVALRVERSERTILGMSLVDDRLMRDVPQTTVSFHNHRIAFPAATEAETRRQILARAYDYLIEVTRHRLAAARVRRQQLEQQRRLLLGDARLAGPGLGSWSGPGRTSPAAHGAADPSDRLRLHQIEGELGALRADSGTLSEQIALVANMLGEPREHLRFERLSMTLDHMNVKQPLHARRSAETMTFTEMAIGTDRLITLETIRFPRDELPEPADFLADAQRVFQLASSRSA